MPQNPREQNTVSPCKLLAAEKANNPKMQYLGNQPSYVDNGDGTVTDLNTGLMWQQDPGEKMTYDQAIAGASSFNVYGGE